MFFKNAFFSAAICVAVSSACTPTSSTSEMPVNENLSPKQKDMIDIDNQLKILEKKREYCKARLYVDTDESMRTEFDNNWETYEGNLNKQEFTSAQLKQLESQIQELQNKKKTLESKI